MNDCARISGGEPARAPLADPQARCAAALEGVRPFFVLHACIAFAATGGIDDARRALASLPETLVGGASPLLRARPGPIAIAQTW